MDLYLPTHRLDAASDNLLDHEWLLTNGTGAYSMGTALGCNTRRYHGLLIAAITPPVGRIVALNQVHDEVMLHTPGDAPDLDLPLTDCLFRGDAGTVHHPEGGAALATFEKGVTAAWVYRGTVAGHAIEVRRELVLHWKKQAITLRYHLQGPGFAKHDATLRLAPMLTLRDFHSLLHRDDPPSFEMSVEPDHHTATFKRGGISVTMQCRAGRFEAAPDWWYDLTYPRDTDRGQADREDYFVPGTFTVPLRHGVKHTIELTATLGIAPVVPGLPHARVKHLRPMMERLPGDAKRRTTLAIAADDFVVARTVRGKALSTILAGYPWFADWGRDTFIALPGLLICTGRLDEAERVLRAFAGSLRNGLVPNRFDDYDEGAAQYNTIDASLWFVHAGLEYAAARGRTAKGKGGSGGGWLMDALRQVVEAYAAGTTAEDHDGNPVPITMDADGLITAGNDHSQLTWMDAAVGDTVFTPRAGKCVEINALWHSALGGLADLIETRDPDTAGRYRELAARVAVAFVATFCPPAPAPAPEASQPVGLIDHVTPEGQADPAFRPNQIFAASLERSPLPDALKPGVVAAVRDRLLTPFGLRTLPPQDPNYHPHYAGPQRDRDEAYHQGTVWPWLIGPYAEAILRVGHFSKPARADARAAITPLLDHLATQGLGQLPELFDGNVTDPQTSGGRGTPAQAWSVAEVLRVLTLIETP